jgi:hypothetical protein
MTRKHLLRDISLGLLAVIIFWFVVVPFLQGSLAPGGWLRQ